MQDEDEDMLMDLTRQPRRRRHRYDEDEDDAEMYDNIDREVLSLSDFTEEDREAIAAARPAAEAAHFDDELRDH